MRYEAIYREHADRYDELVRHEDHQQNVSRWLAETITKRPSLAVELGAGTGRLTRLLAALSDDVHAYDASAHMVEYARRAIPASNVTFGVADNAAIPEPDTCADLVVAGWTFGHAIGFFPKAWEVKIEDAMHEMMRFVVPGGRAVIFETLGTAVDAPAPPNAALGAFYTLLERRFGFTRTTLSTDYAFATLEEAARVLGFFFGETMGARVRQRGRAIVPEWTGAWTRTR